MSGSESVNGKAGGSVSTVIAVGAVFIAWSLMNVPVPGVNEPHYLTKARHFADPNWCAEDFFLQSANAHAVFFALVGPVTSLVSFEFTAVLGRILSLLLFACGWAQLGRRIGLDGFVILLSSCLFCLLSAAGNFSGEWIVGGFESKVPAYGFALLAIASWIDAFRFSHKRSYVAAGIMAGFSVSLHPVVGLWFCLAIAMCEVVCVRKQRLVAQTSGVRLSAAGFVANSAAFILPAMLFALPGLIPALRLVLASTVDKASQDTANFIQVFWRLAHHLDPARFPLDSWLYTAALLVVIVVALFVLDRVNENGGESVDERGGRLCWFPLMAMLVAAAVIAAVGIGIGWHSGRAQDIADWQWRAALLRFYPFRMFDALLPVTASLVMAAVVAAVIVRPAIRTAVVAVFVIGLCVVGWGTRAEAPSAYSRHDYAEWKEACGWLNENTAEDSLVFGPRESFGLKWYANRAEYICFKDCPQDAAGILEWNSRLWKIFHWSQLSYRNERFDNTDLQALQRLTNVGYVLTRQLGPFEAEPVYQNSVWRIYKVPPSL